MSNNNNQDPESRWQLNTATASHYQFCSWFFSPYFVFRCIHFAAVWRAVLHVLSVVHRFCCILPVGFFSPFVAVVASTFVFSLARCTSFTNLSLLCCFCGWFYLFFFFWLWCTHHQMNMVLNFAYLSVRVREMVCRLFSFIYIFFCVNIYTCFSADWMLQEKPDVLFFVFFRCIAPCCVCVCVCACVRNRRCALT